MLPPVRYERDYYINDSQSPSGSRNKKSFSDFSYIKADDKRRLDNGIDDSVSDFEVYRNHRISKMEEKLDKYYTLEKRSNKSKMMKTMRLTHQPGDKRLTDESIGDSVFAHIEKHALHSDIRRNSFSSRNGTLHFVLNPLFDRNGDNLNNNSIDQINLNEKF